MLRKLKCLLGFHAPDVWRVAETIKREGATVAYDPTFTTHYRRCFHCDRVIGTIEQHGHKLRRVK